MKSLLRNWRRLFAVSIQLSERGSDAASLAATGTAATTGAARAGCRRAHLIAHSRATIRTGRDADPDVAAGRLSTRIQSEDEWSLGAADRGIGIDPADRPVATGKAAGGIARSGAGPTAGDRHALGDGRFDFDVPQDLAPVILDENDKGR